MSAAIISASWSARPPPAPASATTLSDRGRLHLSVSVGRAVLASTGRDWEAVGLAPTVPTEVGGALDVAHALALRRLAAAAPAQDRARLEAIAEGVAARGERRAPALPLAAYAGSYGERVLSVDGDRLYYRRGTRPRVALIALGGMFSPSTTIRRSGSTSRSPGNAATAFVIGGGGGPKPGTLRADALTDKAQIGDCARPETG